MTNEEPLKILLVEDDAINYLDVQSILEAEGYQLLRHPAKPMIDNYEDALAVANLETPHIAILDISINGEKDGVQIGQYIRENFYSPIIFLSGYNTEENLRRSGMLGAEGFVVKLGKPFELHQLLTDIKRLHPLARIAAKRRMESAPFYLKEVDGKAEKDIGHHFRTIRIPWNELQEVSTTTHFTNSVIFCLTNGRKYVYHKLLAETLPELSPSFIRISGSKIINTDLVDGCKGDWLLYINNEEYKVGISFRTEEMQALLRRICPR